MRLVRLAVRDFRNLAEVDLAPSPRTTILVGENGQGKTNLLEAVYVLTTLKPLRAARLQELVRFGAERAQVAGDFHGPGGVRRAAVVVQAGGRTAFLDGKPQEAHGERASGSGPRATGHGPPRRPEVRCPKPEQTARTHAVRSASASRPT